MKAATRKSDGAKVAVKCISKAALAPEDEEALQVEVAILTQIDHPNIISLIEFFDTAKTFYMVRARVEIRGAVLDSVHHRSWRL